MTLEQLAQALLGQDHYAKQQIKDRCDGVLKRRDHLKELAVERGNKLQHSRSYQLLLNNIDEVSSCSDRLAYSGLHVLDFDMSLQKKCTMHTHTYWYCKDCTCMGNVHVHVYIHVRILTDFDDVIR